MSFAAHLDALDAAAFERLSDDTEAVWTPVGRAPVTPVRVMVGPVERATEVAGMSLVEAGEAVRFLAAELAERAPGVEPGPGDTVVVAGASGAARVLVLHGQAWREHEGRDWVCAVRAAG